VYIHFFQLNPIFNILKTMGEQDKKALILETKNEPVADIRVRLAVMTTFVCWLPTMAAPILIMCGNMRGDWSGPDYIGAIIVGAIPILAIPITPIFVQPVICKIFDNNTRISLRKFLFQAFILQGVATGIALLSQLFGMIWTMATGIKNGGWFSPLAATIGLGITAILAGIIGVTIFITHCYNRVTKHVDA
jgi:hypothetical protein